MRLSFLVAGTMIPMLLFAVGLITWTYLRDRDAAFDRVMETVRSIRIVLDSEVNSITAGLKVLAPRAPCSRAILTHSATSAEAFANLYAEDSALVLADRDGRQIINTRVPAGTLLPPRQNHAGTGSRFSSTGRPFYSKVFIGSVSQTPLITIDVPVIQDGSVAYVLFFFNPPIKLVPAHRRAAAPERRLDHFTVRPGWRQFRARVPNPSQTIGQRASPTLYAELFKADEAKISTVSLEGVPLLTAFTRST